MWRGTEGRNPGEKGTEDAREAWKERGGKWEKYEKITHHTQYFAMISKLKKHAEVEAYTNGAGPGRG